jgi:hypothetical protein
MKCLTLPVVVLIIGFVASAQTGSNAAATALRKLNTTVDWNVSSAKAADVDCDGKPDTVILGSERDTVVVGVVWGKASKQPQVFMFPVGRPAQDGFCSNPTTINVSPLNCQTNDGRPLPGCKVAAGCRAFAIPDNDYDPFNFYWGSSRAALSWWRL